MDWTRGFSASYYAQIVDPITWGDVERVEILDGNISRTDKDLRVSADVDFVDYDQSKERWIRLYLDAKQGEEIVHVPLFTGIASSPSKKMQGSYTENEVQCYSVLKPAEDILLRRGWYAPVGVSGSQIVKDLLGVIPAPVKEEVGAPALREAIIAEDNETNLSMIDKVLSAIDWRLRLKGDGSVVISPPAQEPVAKFDPLENDAIEPSVDVEEDWFSAPNVLRATSDDLTAIARDDDEISKLSTVSRGREIWAEESDSELNENENIAAYAMRKLKEKQSVAYKVKYNRRYNPDIVAGDKITLHYPEQGVDGVFKVVSQTMSMGYGGRISEEVVKV